ncbi:uncharacterized protein LACBIDRAFT_322596 [Laccaria bicolor S238N-H82]|uniref:Predicted protein n=1 Tax=Laccaria bicolor (strain S238N-H82 / ATCC MYA-4686) TaxID=486041 RepID=B0CWV4_LACBS|nr:uncharacterized protein LACBIDRAFT_322596 [Laccaria bicolor S238N-H82]EDR13137.1 predicted protein [Laccaria bicolor S238N-H82]|eukprot:XP_001875635.1 predicted protein [Laccaria bicolor S238N-H82]
MRTLVYEDMVWRHKLRNRTILTGGLMRPTLYHGPLPRMKPQPIHVTGMIVSRKKAREKRMERQRKLLENINALQIERDFEAGLIAESPNPAGFEPVFSGKAHREWVSPIEDRLAEIQESYALEQERSQRPFPQEMLDQIVRARTERIANKTRERQRERRGEVLKRTIERKNQGPPAHVLAKMTRAERRLDWISRGVSEVGYVGQVKRKLGFKLREPDALKREEGRESERGRMDEVSKEISEENERRRREVEG